MENIFILVLLLALFFLVYVFFKEIVKQRKSKVGCKQAIDKSLDRQLLVMLGGDKKAALRLLRSARQNHPGRSYLWYHEKVIRDLERDRRY